MNSKPYYLRADLKASLTNGDVFKQLSTIDGDVFRDKEGRRTLRLTLAGKPYFLKYHSGVGWLEIFKNLLQGRQPIISARNEWLAIKKLTQLGIETMTLAGYGEKGWNPAKRASFVITDELVHTISLEYLGEQWRRMPPTFASKQAMITKLATISAKLHQHGINHRDFYLCHFLVDERFAEHNQFTVDMPVYLIDLHRAQLRRKIPQRWQVKDLGSLYFSANDVPLTRRDKLRFMQIYSGLPLRELLSKQVELWQQVEKRAEKLLAE